MPVSTGHKPMAILRLKARCPVCRAKTGVPMVYGLPGDALLTAANNKQVLLGGCVIWPHQPDRGCLRCGHRWRHSTSGCRE
jgi:hypothetical protein